MKKLSVILSGVTSLVVLFAFSYSENINSVDAAGKRQGYWKITAAMLRLETFSDPTQVAMEGSYVDSEKNGVWIS